MNTIIARNVNDALAHGVHFLSNHGVPIAPRGMPTLEIPGPVGTTYMKPYECVLFDSDRDANPFFHLFEALWILAGRSDVAFLVQFNKNMKQFALPGNTSFHAPYGHRMMSYYHGEHDKLNQVDTVLDMLRRDPDTRQAVIQIWRADYDLNIKDPDIPCNLIVLPKVRSGRLNITVLCRSNDMIWGAYGANAVQFSMLQQYMAYSLGVDVGTYTQISDSFHVYTENTQGSRQKQMWEKLKTKYASGEFDSCPYTDGTAVSLQLVHRYEEFNSEVRDFCYYALYDHNTLLQGRCKFNEPFLTKIAVPMFKLWNMHEYYKGTGELSIPKFNPLARLIHHGLPNGAMFDWIKAGIQWVARHEKKEEQK